MYGFMPIGAMAGLSIMLIFRRVKWGNMEEIVKGGINLMGLIAMVMLVPSGYASVMRHTGGVNSLIEAAYGMMEGSKFMSTTVMILMRLVITVGIGTFFGTVPIIAAIYCPMATELGFSVPATILLIVVAVALGDAGSPASDTTLGFRYGWSHATVGLQKEEPRVLIRTRGSSFCRLFAQFPLRRQSHPHPIVIAIPASFAAGRGHMHRIPAAKKTSLCQPWIK